MKIRIDGLPVEARPGETLLAAARRAGAFVPALCWDPRLEPGGHCRLCVVAVRGRRQPVAACVARVEEGMEVETATGEIRSLQRTLLEMVLSENPADPDPGTELHELAARLGVSRGRFAGRPSGRSIDDPNPFLLRDYDKCISCYRCTRICDEVEGDHAIAPAGRGFETRIATAFDRGLMESPCTLCGQCIHTCPTGALADRKMIGAGATKRTPSVCGYCGVGCGVILHSKENRVIGVTPDLEAPANRGALCVKGQFGLDFASTPNRLARPLIREGDRFREASWDEALDLVALRLRGFQGTPDSFYAIASGRGTNEAAYLLQKFARTVMGTNQVDNCARA
jgi:predicted molibdopterin-dependent oxidoreductase YjgC